MSLWRLYRRFRWWDWIFLVVICALTVLQVWCTMLNVDYMQNLIAAIQYNRQSDALYNGGMIAAMAASVFACQVIIAFLASEMTASLATRLRDEVYQKVNDFSVGDIGKFSTASLITRTSNDIENVQMSTLMMFRMIFSAPVTAVWAICKFASEASAELTWVVAISVLVIVVVLTVVMAFVLPKFKVAQKFIDRLNQVTREGISGVRVVRAYNAENYQNEKFKKANDDLTKVNLFTGRMLQLFNPVMSIVLDGATLGIYAIGASLMKTGETDYSVVVSFANLAVQVIMAFMMLLFLFVMLPRAMVSAKRIDEVLRTPSTVVDPLNPISPAENIHGELTFHDVGFAYPDAEEEVVAGVDFQIKQGQTLAFIGATGSGKSTIIHLIPRLFDCSSGEILVDGVNVKDMTQKDLRSRIGFVPQRGNLFHGTVKDNIGFGQETLDEKAIQKAAQCACAEEFIQKMDGGYEAPIASGGTNVSGGQRQRLCIARAAAINPEIFVFDDSFSALDFKTDRTVRENLKKMYPESTKVIVAQRVGTIMDADLILVLDAGKVVGKGTHRELLENCPTYRDIALSQLSKEELGL